ncbi:MAG: recombination mediator RecR [Mycoplasmataceae bacterium]|jgi:recombination protein RecR|nr:recombination mediator RecR [Mycoplasmataceae bacterium]
MKHASFEYLVDALKSLPGVGNKQADKIAHFLISKDDEYIEEFINRIRKAKQNVHFCSQCNNYSSDDLCEICSNPSRSHEKLCIVSSQEDLKKIEDTNSFDGIYFVIDGEIKVKSRTKLSSETVSKFINLLHENNFVEIILATNWTIDGEATASFIKGIVREISPKTRIYRLALGLPINSALDYADSTTLKHAIKNKTDY